MSAVACSACAGPVRRMVQDCIALTLTPLQIRLIDARHSTDIPAHSITVNPNVGFPVQIHLSYQAAKIADRSSS